VQWWNKLVESCYFQWKVISLAEMYIQNAGWREQWNENPKYKNIQFCQRQIEKLYKGS
jgi:hypothetical protein